MAGRTNADKITKLLDTMERDDLVKAVRILQKDTGDSMLLRALKAATAPETSFNAKDIARWAAKCTEMDYRKWYSVPLEDGYGGELESDVVASRLIVDKLRESFEEVFQKIVASGDAQKAAEYLEAIADGLDDSDGLLRDESSGFPTEYAERLRGHASRRDYENVFEY